MVNLLCFNMYIIAFSWQFPTITEKKNQLSKFQFSPIDS